MFLAIYGVVCRVTIVSGPNDYRRHTKSGGLIALGGAVNTREVTDAVSFFGGKLVFKKAGIYFVGKLNVITFY